MRYEIEIVESVGPLMTAALADIDSVHISRETQLTIVGAERISPQSFLRLYELGLEIEVMRCRDMERLSEAGEAPGHRLEHLLGNDSRKARP